VAARAVCGIICRAGAAGALQRLASKVLAAVTAIFSHDRVLTTKLVVRLQAMVDKNLPRLRSNIVRSLRFPHRASSVGNHTQLRCLFSVLDTVRCLILCYISLTAGAWRISEQIYRNKLRTKHTNSLLYVSIEKSQVLSEEQIPLVSECLSPPARSKLLNVGSFPSASGAASERHEPRRLHSAYLASYGSRRRMAC
jgi:hypothetical protein